MKHYPNDDDDDTPRNLWQQSPQFRALTYLAVLVALLFLFAIVWQDQVVSYRPQTSPAPHSAQPHLVVSNIQRAAPLNTFPVSPSGWRDSLNPGGSIPERGFDAYYLSTVALEKIRAWPGDPAPDKIDPNSEAVRNQALAPIEDYTKLWRENPKNLIARENTPDISIHYAWSEFKNIPANFLGVYWTGWLDIDAAGEYEFVAAEGYASFRILLDRHQLQNYSDTRKIADPAKGKWGEIKGDAIPRVRLEPGRYLLEVEYLNDWHTTDFTLNINQLQ